MTGSEKFNKVTSLIEDKVRQDEKSRQQIATEVTRELGLNERELSSVFMFITGMSLHEYIRQRKLNAACERLITSEEFDVQSAISISGLCDQSALNKSIKKVYALTPKEVFNKKDESILKIQMTWDQAGTTEITVNPTDKKESSNASSQIFGVNRSKFEEIKEIIELSDIYGFDEVQSEVCYYIYITYDVSLKEAFRFVSEFQYEETPSIDDNELKMELVLPDDYEFEPDEDIERYSREDFYKIHVKEVAGNSEVRYVYFCGDMNSIYTAYNVIEKFHAAGITDVTKIDIDIINICAYNEIGVRYCIRAVRYFYENATEEHGEEAFWEYIEYILENEPIETAFSNIMRLKCYDNYDDVCLTDDDFEYDEMHEKWIEAETDYSDKFNPNVYPTDYDDYN